MRAIFVHGYNFGPDDDPSGQYDIWEKFCPYPIVPWKWDSDPGWWESWKAGKAHPYHCAWHDAEAEGLKLRSALKDPCVVVCHSLGSRVALSALATTAELAVKRVLIFNGSDTVRHAREALSLSGTMNGTVIYSVRVPADGVLRWAGALFTPGRVYEPVIGLQGVPDPPENWREIVLTNGGNNPRSFLDHWFSFRNPANWPRWQAILEGKPWAG